jgi:hypothetical protein
LFDLQKQTAKLETLYQEVLQRYQAETHHASLN